MEFKVGIEYTGIIRHRSPNGFCFIKADGEYEEDVFVHYTDFLDIDYSEVEVGNNVVFEVEVDEKTETKKLKAVNVKVIK